MKLRSVPAPVPSTPPTKSIVSAICSALLVPAPWSSSVAVSIARPFLPFGSWAAPARTIMRTLTTGCSFWLTRTTCMPLASLRISYGGNVTGRAGSGRGGFSRGQSTRDCASDRSRAGRLSPRSLSVNDGVAAMRPVNPPSRTMARTVLVVTFPPVPSSRRAA